jgi:XTP/dITP diphosphohydrolase
MRRMNVFMPEITELLVATGNAGKVREMRQLLADLPLRLRGLDEFPTVAEVPETAETFACNARLKARGYAAQTGLWTLADDSGLAVDALNGAPGVYSARYGGAGLTAADRVQFLLKELKDTPENERRARFVCVVMLANPAGEIIFTAEGVCAGRLAFAPRGAGGFGYDPIFLPDGYTQTFGEIPAGVKNTFSHRARALAQVREFLTAAKT